MITELTDLPDGVVGFEVDGKVEAADYTEVVARVLKPAFASGEVRCVIVMKGFEGMSGSALWADLKVGMGHMRGWKRIALVTDIGWATHLTDLFGWLTPGEVKTFPLAKRQDAVAWTSS
jgi:SpoIIAA-like